MKCIQSIVFLVLFVFVAVAQETVHTNDNVAATENTETATKSVPEQVSETAPSAAAAQIRTRFGALEVPLRIEGQSFTVRFSPERKSSVDVATQICNDRAADLGVTQENYERCVNGVANYVQDYVETWTNEKILRFPITINETEFSLRFIPELRNSKGLAEDLCNQYSQASGLKFETEANCILPAQQFIQRRIDSFYSEKTLEVPLTINDNFTFNIRFLPERQSPVEVATNLCVNYAKELELTEETVRPNCIAPVANFLADQVDRWVRSKTLEFSFKANGKDYSVSFLPERTSSLQVAQQFCVENAEDFQLTNENVIAKCVNPISEFVQRTVAQWIESKRVTIPVEVGGKRVNVVFVPERENIVNVARNVCVQQVDALGLTDENFLAECVNPLSAVLRQGLANWVAERRQKVAQTQPAAATPAEGETATQTSPPAVTTETTTA